MYSPKKGFVWANSKRRSRTDIVCNAHVPLLPQVPKCTH
jgi:hypothetical protein